MKIDIRVTTRAGRNAFVRENGLWKAYLSALPAGGKANQALLGLLADYFRVGKSKIEIIKGLKSRNKTISIKGI